MASTLPYLGEVTSEALEEQARVATSAYMQGNKLLLNGQVNPAMDLFFKSAAIAVNVVFTARTHGVPVGDKLIHSMNALCDQATHGIKHIMKIVAAKKLMKHNALLHPEATATEAPLLSGHGNLLLVRSQNAYKLWSKLAEKGIPVTDLKIVDGGLLVSGRSADILKAARRGGGISAVS